MVVSANYGYLFGGPNNKDYSILGSVSANYGYLFGGPNNKDYGSVLGSPYFGKLPYMPSKFYLYRYIYMYMLATGICRGR